VGEVKDSIQRKSIIWNPVQRGYVILCLGPGCRCLGRRLHHVGFKVKARVAWSENISGEQKFICFETYVRHCMRHALCRWGAATVHVHRPRGMGYLGGTHEERM